MKLLLLLLVMLLQQLMLLDQLDRDGARGGGRVRGVGLVLNGLDLVGVQALGLLLELGLLLGQLVAEGEDLRHGEMLFEVA